MLRILHIAPQNYAGVPYSFYEMHNVCGDYSRIITLHKNPLQFSEDICLEFPLPVFSAAKYWRRKKVENSEQREITYPHYFKPVNFAEKLYFFLNDSFRKPAVEKVICDYKLNSFDIIHYDAGLDFYRYPHQALKWKKAGKKIVCCYYGSDLRLRGLIRELDEISDLNITSEYDHLRMKDDLHYIFYPYSTAELPRSQKKEGQKIKIVHSPTNRKYKGTELILSVIDKLRKEREFEFILCEGVPRGELLEIKVACDISIDQVGGSMGGTGYGKAGLETLGMGIPTITNMTEDYENWLPENPFVVANDGTELFEQLIRLIDDEVFRLNKGKAGKVWVEKYHSFEAVNAVLKKLYEKKGII
ncbi:MAG: glycosyltransferase family 1 protein [Ignavibacteriaceae bacterium]|nr:glycosyltransferase family 1 protein [Ignavibacteriaceae bacterium]